MTFRTALRELARGLRASRATRAIVRLRTKLRKLSRGSKRRHEAATRHRRTMKQRVDETQEIQILHIRLSSAPAVLSGSSEASTSSSQAMETGNRQRPSDVGSAIATRDLRELQTIEVKGKRSSSPPPTMATQHPQTSGPEDTDSGAAARPRQSSDLKGRRKPRATVALKTSYKRPESYESPRDMGQENPSPSAYLFHGFPGEPVPFSNRDALLANRPRLKTPQACRHFDGCGDGSRGYGGFMSTDSAIVQPMGYANLTYGGSLQYNYSLSYGRPR